MVWLNQRSGCELESKFVRWFLVLGWPLSLLFLLFGLICAGIFLAVLFVLAFLAEMTSVVTDALTSYRQT